MRREWNHRLLDNPGETQIMKKAIVSGCLKNSIQVWIFPSIVRVLCPLNSTMSIIHIAILNLLLNYQEIKLLLFLKDPGLRDIQLGGGSYLSEHLSTRSIDPPHSNSGATSPCRLVSSSLLQQYHSTHSKQ